MHDLALINRAINTIMNKYAIDSGYADGVTFESKAIFSGALEKSGSTMFSLTLREGLYKMEPFKIVIGNFFMDAISEDDVVKMVCDMFKNVISQLDKIQCKTGSNNSLNKVRNWKKR